MQDKKRNLRTAFLYKWGRFFLVRLDIQKAGGELLPAGAKTIQCP